MPLVGQKHVKAAGLVTSEQRGRTQTQVEHRVKGRADGGDAVQVWREIRPVRSMGGEQSKTQKRHKYKKISLKHDRSNDFRQPTRICTFFEVP